MRLIDADELSRVVCSNDCENCSNMHRVKCVEQVDLMDVQGWIEDAPTVDPVKHGHWMDELQTQKECKVLLSMFHKAYICSVCKYMGRKSYLQQHFKKLKYCPDCGAKMDEVSKCD